MPPLLRVSLAELGRTASVAGLRGLTVADSPLLCRVLEGVTCPKLWPVANHTQAGPYLLI